ncbi:hypothetical protein [Aquincola sp. J276]|uniref:hypothetical protein n=1 Tax=Aquincola sp. J276 TaxID=2898432 RepID=UPI00215088CD|nr:hypothetical protein [Aquincola sp. J276]MCR5868299.1 hypothetical protein [Aquincola sp. J276]
MQRDAALQRQVAAPAHLRAEAGQPGRDAQRIELRLHVDALRRTTGRGRLPAGGLPAQAGAQGFQPPRLGGHFGQAAVGIEAQGGLQVLRGQPGRLRLQPVAGRQLGHAQLPQPRGGLPLAIAPQRQHGAATGGRARAGAGFGGIGPGRRAHRAVGIQAEAVAGQAAVHHCLQVVDALHTLRQALGLDVERQRRGGVGRGPPLGRQALQARVARHQAVDLQIAFGLQRRPAALQVEAALGRAGPWHPGLQARAQRAQWRQGGQRRGGQPALPAVGGRRAAGAAFQFQPVAGGFHLAAELVGAVAGPGELAGQRHAGQQAVAQVDGGGAAQRLQQAGRASGRGGAGVGLPAAVEAVRALAPGGAGRAGDPRRGVEGGEFATAAQRPGTGGFHLEPGSGLCPGAAGGGAQLLQLGQQAAVGLALGAGLQLHAGARRAGLGEAAVERAVQRGHQRRAGRCAAAVGRGQAGHREVERSADRHGRGAGIQLGRLHRGQLQRQRQGIGLPAATAFDAARARQIGLQPGELQRAAVRGRAAQREAQALERQAQLVPAAGQRIAQVQLQQRGLVGAHAVHAHLAVQPRARQPGSQRCQVQRLQAGAQRGQRPGGERRQRGLCIQPAGFAGGSGHRRGAQRSRQPEAVDGAAGLQVGFQRKAAVGRGPQGRLRLQRHRALGVDAAVGGQAQAVAGEAGALEQMHAAVVGAQVQACGDVGDGGLVVDQQAAHRQAGHLQLDGQAQAGRPLQRLLRRWRHRLGRGAHGDALGLRRLQHQAQQRAFLRAEAPAQVLPAQVVHHHAQAIGAGVFDAAGPIRTAAEHALRRADHQAGHLRQQPGIALLGAQQPGGPGGHQRGDDQQQQQAGQRPAPGGAAQGAQPGRPRWRGPLHGSGGVVVGRKLCGRRHGCRKAGR